jgi:ornithine cyclodeaminase/alanine dehydrogenase-like protein (mu-crystallin family)
MTTAATQEQIRPHTLILTRPQVASLLTIEECIPAVERIFRMHGEGKTSPPGILGVRAAEGGFHIKAGVAGLGRNYFVAKINANFPQNGRRFGLPSIQGLIILADAGRGDPLAVMDSIEITIQRTGAATAVAAKHLSRADSSAATICGCGNQGRIQLQSLLSVRPLDRAFLYDLDPDRARSLAGEFTGPVKVQPVTPGDLPSAVRQSDICVTCTPSRRFFLEREWISPGTFIAAVGADSEEKQELDPLLFRGTRIVADILDQSATIGDLHHALESGVLRRSDVHAELGEIVAGSKEGRISSDEITIFDSTGMALQDAAAAALVYEKAARSGAGQFVTFN